MRSRFFKSLAAGLLFGLGVGSANATLIQTGSEQSLQSVINGLYQSASCSGCSPVSSAPNVNMDQQSPDNLWMFEASNTAAATFVIEIAGNAATNTFGIYDAFNGNQVQLFGGIATGADRAQVSLFDGGAVLVTFFDTSLPAGPGNPQIQFYGAGTFSGNLFGFYLGTVGGTFYSEESKNAGGADQMVAFKGDGDTIKLPGATSGPWGPSSYILAWEDIAYGASDKDFNDFVVYVESIKPIPEPGSLALMGIGMLGLMAATSRRRKNAA